LTDQEELKQVANEESKKVEDYLDKNPMVQMFTERLVDDGMNSDVAFQTAVDEYTAAKVDITSRVDIEYDLFTDDDIDENT
jgi:hypothetical protein